MLSRGARASASMVLRGGLHREIEWAGVLIIMRRLAASNYGREANPPYVGGKSLRYRINRSTQVL